MDLSKAGCAKNSSKQALLNGVHLASRCIGTEWETQRPTPVRHLVYLSVCDMLGLLWDVCVLCSCSSFLPHPPSSPTLLAKVMLLQGGQRPGPRGQAAPTDSSFIMLSRPSKRLPEAGTSGYSISHAPPGPGELGACSAQPFALYHVSPINRYKA